MPTDPINAQVITFGPSASLSMSTNQDNNDDFVINGPLFEDNRTPVGGYILDGKTVKEFIDPKGNSGNFGAANGIFYHSKDGKYGLCSYDEWVAGKIESKDSDGFPLVIDKNNIDFAFQNGPILMEQGENLRLRNDSQKDRSGIGFKADGSLITIHANNIGFHDFSELFKAQGCSDAMYLDGVNCGFKGKTANGMDVNSGYNDEAKKIVAGSFQLHIKGGAPALFDYSQSYVDELNTKKYNDFFTKDFKDTSPIHDHIKSYFDEHGLNALNQNQKAFLDDYTAAVEHLDNTKTRQDAFKELYEKLDASSPLKSSLSPVYNQPKPTTINPPAIVPQAVAPKDLFDDMIKPRMEFDHAKGYKNWGYPTKEQVALTPTQIKTLYRQHLYDEGKFDQFLDSPILDDHKKTALGSMALSTGSGGAFILAAAQARGVALTDAQGNPITFDHRYKAQIEKTGQKVPVTDILMKNKDAILTEYNNNPNAFLDEVASAEQKACMQAKDLGKGYETPKRDQFLIGLQTERNLAVRDYANAALGDKQASFDMTSRVEHGVYRKASDAVMLSIKDYKPHIVTSYDKVHGDVGNMAPAKKHYPSDPNSQDDWLDEAVIPFNKQMALMNHQPYKAPENKVITPNTNEIPVTKNETAPIVNNQSTIEIKKTETPPIVKDETTHVVINDETAHKIIAQNQPATPKKTIVPLNNKGTKTITPKHEEKPKIIAAKSNDNANQTGTNNKPKTMEELAKSIRAQVAEMEKSGKIKDHKFLDTLDLAADKDVQALAADTKALAKLLNQNYEGKYSEEHLLKDKHYIHLDAARRLVISDEWKKDQRGVFGNSFQQRFQNAADKDGLKQELDPLAFKDNLGKLSPDKREGKIDQKIALTAKFKAAQTADADQH